MPALVLVGDVGHPGVLVHLVMDTVLVVVKHRGSRAGIAKKMCPSGPERMQYRHRDN